jgi:hypothetical protein
MALLVKAHTIANRMGAQLFDLLALLFDPIAINRRCDIPNCTKPIMHIFYLKWRKSNLKVFNQPQYIESAGHFAEALRLRN